MNVVVEADVPLMKHLPTNTICRYDEFTCDGVDINGVPTVTLLNLFNNDVAFVARKNEVRIISYLE